MINFLLTESETVFVKVKWSIYTVKKICFSTLNASLQWIVKTVHCSDHSLIINSITITYVSEEINGTPVAESSVRLFSDVPEALPEDIN